MWYVYNIIFDGDEYSYFDVNGVDSQTSIIFKDYSNGDIRVIHFNDDDANNKEQLIKVLREKYGIDGVIGIGTDFIFELNPREVKILECIDYNGLVKGDNLRLESNNYSVFQQFDADKILYTVNNYELTIAKLIIEYPDCYVIDNDKIIVILEDMEYFPCYKIVCDLDKFYRLLTKLRVINK